MTLQHLYLWSKKIHRFVLFILIVLIIAQGGTGMAMKYPWFARLMPFDYSFAWDWHNKISDYFLIALFIMMITGLIMYCVPMITRNRALKAQKNPPANGGSTPTQPQP